MTSGVNLLYSEYDWDSQREKNCALYLSDLFNYVFCAVGRNDGVFIPLPIAGSVYGMVLLFLALVFGIVRLSWVEDVANWLHSVMSLFFIAPAVAIIDVWAEIADVWWILVILMLVAYLVTMITTGVTAESLIGRKQKRSGGKK